MVDTGLVALLCSAPASLAGIQMPEVDSELADVQAEVKAGLQAALVYIVAHQMTQLHARQALAQDDLHQMT